MSDMDKRALLLEVLAELDDAARRILERDLAEGGTASEGPLSQELGLDQAEICRLRIVARTDVEQCLGQPWEDLLVDAGYSLSLRGMSSLEREAERAAGRWRVLTEEQREQVDRELRRRMGADGLTARSKFRWTNWILVSVAAAAAIVVSLRTWTSRAPATLEMTALANPPRGDEQRYFTLELGLDPPKLPRGFGLMGETPPESQGMAPEDWWPIGRDAERRRAERAFGREQVALNGGRFTLCFRATAEVSALALWSLKGGQLELAYPMEGDALRRFAPGEIHYLPREPMALSTVGRSAPALDYDPGFTVPFGEERILVLLALRTDSVDEQFLASFKTELSNWSAAQLPQSEALSQAAAALQTRGFEARIFEVRVR